MHKTLAVPVAKLASIVLKILGRQATSAPGLLALRLEPQILKHYFQQLTSNPVYITGTNGKSTTAGMLASILSQDPRHSPLIHNASGANLLSGLCSCLLSHSNWQGTLTREHALLEVDEAVLHKVTHMKPARAVLVNNFFRDQLDRFGEMQQTIALVQKGLTLQEPNGQLIANADDPNVCHLSAPQTVYFGIDAPLQQEIFAEELASCPACNADLQYTHQWLGQFGDFACPQCGYQKPSRHVLARNIQLSPNGSHFEVYYHPDAAETQAQRLTSISCKQAGLFNVYNAMSAISTAWALGVSNEHIKHGIESYKPLFGRSQLVQHRGQQVQIFLIKNPIGASEVLRMLASERDAKFIIAINDNYADGRDVSWLWDAHFEYLAGNASPMIVSGTRASDMAIRLKYAGISNIQTITSLSQALDTASTAASSDSARKIYILPTYTALLELCKLLKLDY